MPIYEYRCQTCRHEMEVMQKITEDPLTCCPACGKETLSKLISQSSFQLKGTGWYATDFKNPPAKPAETKANPASASASTDTSAKTPAATSTTTEAA